MLETVHREGRGRATDWQPDGREVAVRTPQLIHPDVPQVPLPPQAQIVVTSGDAAWPDRIVLRSGGTWFHPAGGALSPDDTPSAGSDRALVIPATAPAPSDQVQVVPVGDDLAVWHDAGGWASDPARTVAALIEARTQATPGRLLWAPALGTPADYALWTYLGVDLFDASPLLLAAARGVALTPDGPLPAADAADVHGIEASFAALAAFNLRQAHEELARVRVALRDGRLRALVERRVYAHPASVALLRRFDQEHEYLEAATAVQRDAPVPCMTQESLWMPEVVRFRRRLRHAYEPPEGAEVLVLLPCSARKPYKTSKSHRFFQRALDDSGIRARCHEVMVTSPLGVVPRELEEVYPAAQYDVPVTGAWSRDEQHIIRQQVGSLLAKGRYAHVVAHVPDTTYAFIQDLLPEGHHHSASRAPQSIAECDRLRAALKAVKQTVGPTAARRAGTVRKSADMRALASYQFNADVADALTEGGVAKGRPPYVKLFAAEGEQLGMTSAERGILSLTLAGAATLAANGTKRVWIEDFQIKKTSSLFAVGVKDADPDVRPGDEVALLCRTPEGVEMRGCGFAHMTADEMVHARRGVAVQVRHSHAGIPVETPLPGSTPAAREGRGAADAGAQEDDAEDEGPLEVAR